MITLTSVSKTFDGGRTFVVHDLSLHVHRGELLVILGESGSGKTTTLRMINRLVEPTEGSIHVNGRNTSQTDHVELRRSIGYVFQGIGLFPHMTVEENIAVVPRLLGWEQPRIATRVGELMGMMGLEVDTMRHRRPEELSGGQKQRVGVARALAAQPAVLLMDEPFGALDPLTRDSLQTELKRIQQTQQITIVLVTHDMTEALLLGDRIAILRNGTLVAIGTPHDLLTSATDPYVASLMETPKRQADRVEMIARGSENNG